MTIDIGPVGSHGKARIVGYGYTYAIPVSLSLEVIEAGFRKSEYHWDEKEGLIHEVYPLSPEELTEAATEAYKEQVPDIVHGLLAKVKKLEERTDELEHRTAVAIEPGGDDEGPRPLGAEPRDPERPAE